MIHAYEFQLSQPFREWLLLNFHQRMCRRINRTRLQRFMDISTHAEFPNCTHELLFLFKSLDLDLRFRWPFGTVFGYGRKDYFNAARARRPSGEASPSSSDGTVIAESSGHSR